MKATDVAPEPVFQLVPVPIGQSAQGVELSDGNIVFLCPVHLFSEMDAILSRGEGRIAPPALAS